MKAPRWILGTVVVYLAASSAFADNVILKNGAELRNVKVVEQGKYTIKVKISDSSNAIIGTSEIARIEPEGGAPITPAAGPPEAAQPAPAGAQPQAVAAPQAARQVSAHHVYQIPTTEPDKPFEVVLDAYTDGTTDVQVNPPPGASGEKEHVYHLTTEAGETVSVVVQRDDLGEVKTLEINPPEPPRSSPKEVFEHTLKTADGKVLKLRAKIDWNTRKIQDLEFLP